MTKLIDKELLWYKGKQYILKESILEFIKQRQHIGKNSTAFNSGYQYALFCLYKELE
jgi:hypothetical protein